MDFEEASKAGKRVIVETINGGDRVAAHLFLVDGGFVYADIGWDEPMGSWHPFHLVECQIINAGYIDQEGRQLDIYVEDRPTPGRGDRDFCRMKIERYMEQINLHTG